MQDRRIADDVMVHKPVLKGGVAEIEDVLAARGLATVALLPARALSWTAERVLRCVLWRVVW